MLHINDLTYRIGGRVLLDGATAHVPKGHKVGLVGRNGTGKSTLFKLISGEMSVDAGAVNLRPGARLGMVAQEAPSGPKSLIDTVLAADVERSQLLAESETVTDPHRIAEVHTRLADINAHAAPAKAARILSGLGFDEDAQQRPCSDFSGGWRMRVALAAVLFSNPDLLLLDEPTNHLDLEATLWLENYLASWQGTIIVISHDRTLLNTSVEEIIHLEEQRLTRYAGNYDFFEKTRRERLGQQAKHRTKQLAEQRRIQSFVDRFRAKATKARQAQSRLKMLEKMEPIATVIEDKTIAFTFPNPAPLSPPLVAMDDVALGYEPGKSILKDLDLRIDMDDRIALLGANGNGKSTMMKMLAGRLKPQDGKIIKSKKLEVGYFAQHQAEELPETETPFEYMQAKMEDMIESKVRGHLGRFGFEQSKADTPIQNLSGGEKARLLFANMSRTAPHIMLLDEPTNHLDVDAREALVEALNTYDGAVVLVSHDPHLVELVCDRLWLVDDGKCKQFDGDLDDYKCKLMEARRIKKDAAKENSGVTNGPRVDKKADRKARAEARAATAHLRKAVQKAEKEVTKLGAERSQIQEKLADPKLYDTPSDDLTKLQIQLGKIEKQLEDAEEAWLDAESALEKTAG
ncbi:ABC-F family ATP-binding cassette domain-containing protein [Magnetovibrio sp. PR-2]|uniref:ABC-F family ATP-binding cassette domain-containing protein n=1 Tax=Magnetovibrio sp. PR-2 TaxID=3120356 RepID=UPI002FCE05D4